MHQMQHGPPPHQMHQMQHGPPPHQMRGGPPPHQMRGGPPPHQMRGGPPPHQMRGGPPPQHTTTSIHIEDTFTKNSGRTSRWILALLIIVIILFLSGIFNTSMLFKKLSSNSTALTIGSSPTPSGTGGDTSNSNDGILTVNGELIVIGKFTLNGKSYTALPTSTSNDNNSTPTPPPSTPDATGGDLDLTNYSVYAKNMMLMGGNLYINNDGNTYITGYNESGSGSIIYMVYNDGGYHSFQGRPIWSQYGLITPNDITCRALDTTGNLSTSASLYAGNCILTDGGALIYNNDARLLTNSSLVPNTADVYSINFINTTGGDFAFYAAPMWVQSSITSASDITSNGTIYADVNIRAENSVYAGYQLVSDGSIVIQGAGALYFANSGKTCIYADAPIAGNDDTVARNINYINNTTGGSHVFYGPMWVSDGISSNTNITAGTSGTGNFICSNLGNIITWPNNGSLTTDVDGLYTTITCGDPAQHSGNDSYFRWWFKYGHDVSLDQIGNIRHDSDYRIKDNIRPIPDTFVVDNLKPCLFNLKNCDTNKLHIGFIAHELQEVFPHMVTGEKDGEKIQQIETSGLVPILVKEVQDLKKLAKELMTNMTQLMSDNIELKYKIAELELTRCLCCKVEEI
jgi:hypothetical protein